MHYQQGYTTRDEAVFRWQPVAFLRLAGAPVRPRTNKVMGFLSKTAFVLALAALLGGLAAACRDMDEPPPPSYLDSIDAGADAAEDGSIS